MPKNPQPNFNWKIAGEAGHGVMLASKLMAKAAKRHGMQSFNYLEYPSLIRGGHQTGQVYADFDNASCQHRTLDMIVIFTQEGFDIHQDEMDEDTVIIYNSDFGQLKDEYVEEWGDQVYELPISTWAKETAGKALAANVVSLGASAYVLGMDLDVFKEIIADEFATKPKLIDKNKDALDKGYEGAADKMEALMEVDQRKDDRILLNGNEAIGMGAIAAGCQFYSAYPMTPATGLLHFMNEHKHKYPMVVKQVEDEIGAIHEAIGAAVAGVRAATGTSGGGFALMVEGLSFAGTAEVPLVILEAQRTGPASGVPTWTAQADLQFVLTAGHGDFPKVVLTPGTVEEHFELGKKAFYLAEKYQLPVILLSDKYILESHQTMPTPDAVHENERQNMVTDDSDLPEDGSYLRYQDTEDGISQRSIPGQEHGTHLANSYEHDEWGFATEEAEVINQAVEKRSRKMETIMNELPQPQLLGPKTADVTLVGWGSTVNVLLETINQAPEGSVNAIHIPCIKPLPTKKFTKLADKAKKLVMVEGNENGQAEDWIRQETGIEMDDSLHRYDGRPFYAEDLVEYVTK